jgi:arginyl-tRNA synthetase
VAPVGRDGKGEPRAWRGSGHRVARELLAPKIRASWEISWGRSAHGRVMENKVAELPAVPDPLAAIRVQVAQLIADAVKQAWGVELPPKVQETVVSKLEPNRLLGYDLALPCFVFLGPTKQKNPVDVAQKLVELLSQNKQQRLVASFTNLVAGDTGPTATPFLNMMLSPAVLGDVVTLILDKSFLGRLPSNGKERVMIEYSQPNTHKAFHVGHMRNVALGDCLVRMFEALGNTVIAANYFGDEGAHVAKCLWLLRKRGYDLDRLRKEVPVEARGEWLGEKYTEAVAELDLEEFTSLPYPGLISAKVLRVEPHSAQGVPANWRVVQLGVGADKTAEVVCGGTGYRIGDIVAYAPVGARFNNAVVQPKDMKGVVSHGVMVAYHEVGAKSPSELAAEAKAEEEKKMLSLAGNASGAAAGGGSGKAAKSAPAEGAPKKEKKAKTEAGGAESAVPVAKASGAGEKAKGKGKGKEKGKPEAAAAEEEDVGLEDEEVSQAASKEVMLLPPLAPVGEELTEIGRKANAPLPADRKVSAEYAQRLKEVSETLHAMEAGEPSVKQLWEETKTWSLSDFKKIYAWIGARFDHDFFESQCSEPSQRMVDEFLAKGVLVRSDGAVGADLRKYNLGFCVLRKSDGTGLYATKDLALAKRKFDEFKIDRSVYVVDMAQSHHFQQVFKTLELMGYQQAKKCFHLAYGQVVLPSGKMSSRKGNVILFSQLQRMLDEHLMKEFLGKYVGEWPKEEIEHAKRCLSVATIRYGMLNVGAISEIVFEMDKWAAKKGNTGPYLLYAYTRIRKIVTSVPVDPNAGFDYAALDHASERVILMQLSDFWNIVRQVTTEYNPSPMCKFLFDLAQNFSSWYEIEDKSIKNTADPRLRNTRLRFVTAVAETLKRGLFLLGIDVLERM